MKSVMLVCPHIYLPGGIAVYYNSIKAYLPDNVHFFFIGARSVGEPKIIKPLNLLRDMLRLVFYFTKSANKQELVIFNPSLIPYCTLREGIFLRIASIFSKKCIVFFRGWDNKFAREIERQYFKLFYSTYNRSDSFIVLSQEFKKKLREWGFHQPIHLETTTVDDSLLGKYSQQMRMARSGFSKGTINLLFLSRVEKEKGIIETIAATKLLAKTYPDIRLLVAGVGSFVEQAKNYAKEEGVSDKVDFVGWVSGKQKAKLLSESDIYILLSDREGMPNSVLEAMAFGIPVITTPVGGINDFFEDGRFGYLVKDKNPASIAASMGKIISDKDLYEFMSTQSFEYAHSHFLSSIVAKRLCDICSTY